jgi:hypothetical protein
MLAVSTMALLVLLFSFLSYRFGRMRSIVEGTPVLIVIDGRPLRNVLKVERLTVDEVVDAAREQGISDLAEVKMGVLEADGKFSFVKVDQSRPNKAPESKATWRARHEVIPPADMEAALPRPTGLGSRVGILEPSWQMIPSSPCWRREKHSWTCPTGERWPCEARMLSPGSTPW